MTRRDVNVNKGAKNIYNENKTRKRQGMIGMRVSAICMLSLLLMLWLRRGARGEKEKATLLSVFLFLWRVTLCAPPKSTDQTHTLASSSICIKYFLGAGRRRSHPKQKQANRRHLHCEREKRIQCTMQ